ncbi:hypothetical protein RLIN73S_02821 [Rhodanobacter lindaniclasticus]
MLKALVLFAVLCPWPLLIPSVRRKLAQRIADLRRSR